MYVMVIAAGVRLRAAWLPKAIVGSAVGALLALAALNPDRFIADRNVARYDHTGKIDIHYLARLSADAAPALARLPEPLRSCGLAGLRSQLGMGDKLWREWNLGRSLARDVIGGSSAGSTAGCDTSIRRRAER